jgi:hypothetical protein
LKRNTQSILAVKFRESPLLAINKQGETSTCGLGSGGEGRAGAGNKNSFLEGREALSEDNVVM